MPTKKKKYNARFPPARIKKIMQKDEEVGKVASTVPVMLSRLLELFTESLILKTNELTLSVNARTLSTSHLKQVILSERKFDFLKDLVAHIPDVQANDEDGGDSNSDQGNRPRPRGRPKKKKEEGELTTVPKKRGRRPKVVVPLEEDTLLDEYNSEDSETEDADSNENEDIESTSEDANYDQSMDTIVPHVRKRRRIDDTAAAASATTSSFYDPDSQTRVLLNDSTPMMSVEHEGGSANLLTADSKDSTRETLLLPPPLSNAATSWSLAKGFEVPSIEQTANEACVPLNLKTAGNSLSAAAANKDTNKDTNPMTSATQDLETYLMQQQQELQRAVGLNFGKTSYHADGGSVVGGGGLLQVPPGIGLLAPPPAHQPISHSLRQPLTSVCMMQPPFARSNLFSPTASEFVSRINNSPATLDNTSTGMLPSPVPNTSGHAVHRMPVVPASFPGQGACLARSTSMPHGTGITSKPSSSSSLATSPEDDYDS